MNLIQESAFNHLIALIIVIVFEISIFLKNGLESVLNPKKGFGKITIQWAYRVRDKAPLPKLFGENVPSQTNSPIIEHFIVNGNIALKQSRGHLRILIRFVIMFLYDIFN